MFRVGNKLGTTIYRDDEEQPCAWIPGDKSLAKQVVDFLNAVPPQPKEAEPASYKAAVLECHAVMDAVGIPSAKGVTCSDPDCRSDLGHRIRTLRDQNLESKRLLDAITEEVGLANDEGSSLKLAKKVSEILNKNREH